MAISSILNTNPPDQGVSYPYLGSHLHTDNQTLIIWLVLNTGFGVVVNKTGAPVIPATDPVTYYTPNSSVFPLGYSEPNVITRYNVIPYFGSVTIATTSIPI